MPDEENTEGQEATEATPTTEELAAELAAVEETPEPVEEPATPEPEPEPEPAAPAPESPAADPEPEAEPTPEREIAPPTSAQADKKEADAGRRKKAIADAPISTQMRLTLRRSSIILGFITS